jgi:hypothetical protein
MRLRSTTLHKFSNELFCSLYLKFTQSHLSHPFLCYSYPAPSLQDISIVYFVTVKIK